MGTVCSPEERPRQAEFTAQFSVNLRELFDYYKSLLLFIKQSNLFASPSEELIILVDTYLANPKAFPKDNIGLCCIDSTHKLHPVDYGTEIVTKDWLIDACLRQNQFIQDYPFEILNFEESYRHYVQFLYLCFKSPEQIVVPNKLADFMWHSHMQDNYRYRNDSIKMLKKVLNHIDDFTAQQLELHSKKTEEARKRLLRVPERRLPNYGPNISNAPASYHNYVFINYGPGFCGGGHYPHPPNPHPPHPDDRNNDDINHKDHHHDKPHPPYDPNDYDIHHKDHHSNDHHPNNTHPPENNYHHDTNNYHHDTNNHSSCGGGGASSCGGGASSCGGGGSSCGGGGSSCGGGGGD